MIAKGHPTFADLGFTAAEAQAAQTAWTTPQFDVLLTKDVRKLREAGFSLEQVIDAKRHYLLNQTTVLFRTWNIPAHWASLMTDEPRVENNLRDDDRRYDTALLDYAFAQHAVPYAYFVNTLIAAEDHQAVWTSVRRWVAASNGQSDPVGGTKMTTAEIEAEAAMFAGYKPQPRRLCTC